MQIPGKAPRTKCYMQDGRTYAVHEDADDAGTWTVEAQAPPHGALYSRALVRVMDGTITDDDAVEVALEVRAEHCMHGARWLEPVGTPDVAAAMRLAAGKLAQGRPADPHDVMAALMDSDTATLALGDHAPAG